MNSLLEQSFAVIKMNVRSIPRRLWMSLAMIFASSVVVAILLAFLAMAKGFEATLEGAGSDDVAIFLREGSAAELNSSVIRDQVNLINAAPGLKKTNDQVESSAELYVIVDGIKKSTKTEANIPLRGLDLEGLSLRKGFELVDGRLFTPGTNELIVGRGILQQFEGFELNQDIRFGKSSWKVVGIFSTGGNVFESELWADSKVVQSVYNRSAYQTVRARLESPAALTTVQEYSANDPRLKLEVKSEKAYYAEQGKQLGYIAIFGQVISTVMALGALAGALNTMYTSVADRAKEIATLRAIGFSNASAFIGTLVEALVLAAIGGLLGSLAAFLLFDGLSASTLGGSFSQVVFSFKLTQALLIEGIVWALVIGFISGFFPAFKAARMPVIVAFQAQH